MILLDDRRRHADDRRRLAVRAVEALEGRRLFAGTFYVTPEGNDTSTGDSPATAWQTIQKAFDAATPGSTVLVAPGTYREKLTLNVSGNEADGPIRFVADGSPGEVVISGKRVGGDNLIHIVDRDFVSIEGFDLRDNTGVRDGSGIRIEGVCRGIEILSNRIQKIRGRNAMGITVYGTDAVDGISDLTIDGNEIFKCQAAPSEALTLNGNVHGFAVTNNYVHHVNNIGIDFIGGEGLSPDPATDQVRSGICSGNRVERARSNYGGGYAAGIYVDGGRDIVIERNTVTDSDLGIEVGCENVGRTAENITVRNNLLANNSKAGLAFGGYAPDVGRVVNSTFVNNTLYRNGRKARGAGGEIWVQLGSGNIVENNLIVGGGRKPLLMNDENEFGIAPTNNINFNLYFADHPKAKPKFIVAGEEYPTLAEYIAASGREAASLFADPLLSDPESENFRLGVTSPAIDAGDPAITDAGSIDLLGNTRLVGVGVDLGAIEVG